MKKVIHAVVHVLSLAGSVSVVATNIVPGPEKAIAVAAFSLAQAIVAFYNSRQSTQPAN